MIFAANGSLPAHWQLFRIRKGLIRRNQRHIGDIKPFSGAFLGQNIVRNQCLFTTAGFCTVGQKCGKALFITDILIVVLGALVFDLRLALASFVGFLIKTWGIDGIILVLDKISDKKENR